jgi:hypothetical protein
MKIDRKIAGEIQGKVRDFINSLESQYGITVSKNSATYTDGSLNLRINCVVTEDKRDEGVLTINEQKYDLEAQIHGLPPRGTVFTSPYGDSYIIKEWIPRGRKYQVSGVRVSDGKKFKFPMSTIKDCVK